MPNYNDPNSYDSDTLVGTRFLELAREAQAARNAQQYGQTPEGLRVPLYNPLQPQNMGRQPSMRVSQPISGPLIPMGNEELANYIRLQQEEKDKLRGYRGPAPWEFSDIKRVIKPGWANIGQALLARLGLGGETRENVRQPIP